MAWDEGAATLVRIFEGTEVSTKERGLGERFVFVREGDQAFAPDGSRRFWLEFFKISTKRENAPDGVLPLWFRFEGAVILTYPVDVDPTFLFSAIAGDYARLVKRVDDTALWEQPTSTIESLWLGAETISEADIQVTDEGVLVSMPFTMECREF